MECVLPFSASDPTSPGTLSTHHHMCFVAIFSTKSITTPRRMCSFMLATFFQEARCRRPWRYFLSSLGMIPLVNCLIQILSFSIGYELFFLGVRGNQDQPVIEWRAYFEWVRSKPNGKKWLESYGVFLGDCEDEADTVRRRCLDSDGIFGRRSRKKQPPKHSYPPDWKWGKNHWDLARKMSYNEYSYLLGLPLVRPYGHVSVKSDTNTMRLDSSPSPGKYSCGSRGIATSGSHARRGVPEAAACASARVSQ